MATTRKKQFITLLVGDIAVFVVSLWAALALRNVAIPSVDDFAVLLAPFIFIFAAWVLVFFISGLYDSHTLLIKSKLPRRVFAAHLFNLAIATILFYIVPFFGITPKAILILYVAVSSVLIALWRFLIYPKLVKQSSVPLIILAEGEDVEYLDQKIKSSSNSPVRVIEILKPSVLESLESADVLKKIKALVAKHPNAVIAVDLINPSIQKHADTLYSLIFTNIQFVEIQNVYEDITDKVPLGLINEVWFLKHASIEPNVIYDFLKRAMDIAISLPLCIVPILTYPFIWIMCQFGEHKGPVFIFQQRVGERDKLVNVPKFRSMTVDDDGVWVKKNDQRITKFGSFLRKSRLDEFVQLLSILRGEISLIGPRPELPKLVEFYKIEIPHYNVRHLIKPGLSGWAQIHHEKPPHSVEETKEKLAYDLYYIKHRSLWLDLKIALQTVKTLLSRVGV
jgi:lipopolysaccharide/colanic/teichoic acid biosynthesis glycosyltransferase